MHTTISPGRPRRQPRNTHDCANLKKRYLNLLRTLLILEDLRLVNAVEVKFDYLQELGVGLVLVNLSVQFAMKSSIQLSMA